MKLAFILLAHDNPDRVLALARQLAAEGDRVVIHWDSQSLFDLRAFVSERLSGEERENVLFAARAKVKWGEWGMVEATLNALECLTDIPGIDYVYLLSAADALIRPLPDLKRHLEEHQGRNFMECVNPHTDKWVIRGLVHERYRHFHFLNWKDNPKLFSCMHHLQAFFNIKRSVPENMTVYFGSQWWCLTYPLAMKILRKARTGSVLRFFRYTSVPDEMFFQTLAAYFEDPGAFLPQLTYYRFDARGKPLVFYDDHIDFIRTLPHFFIRKVSEQAGRIHNFLLEEQTPPYNALEFHDTNAFYIPRVPKGDQLFYGNLLLNTQPYYCLLAFNPDLLADMYRNFAHGQGCNVFLNLFNEEALVYGSETPVHPSYDSGMTRLRDHAPMTLVYSILQYFSTADNVFCFLPSQEDMFKPLFWDDNALPIFLLPGYITDALRVSFGSQGAAMELSPVPLQIFSNHLLSRNFTSGPGDWEIFFSYVQECLKHDMPFLILNEKQKLGDILQHAKQKRAEQQADSGEQRIPMPLLKRKYMAAEPSAAVLRAFGADGDNG